jgi:hypothetical protein
MPITAITPIRIGHALERFYFGIDMLNDNPPPRKFFIIRFFPAGQLMVFAYLYWYETVWMELFYPKVSTISVKRYRIAQRTPDAVLIHLEVMLAAFGLVCVKYFCGVPLNDGLGLACGAFFPE